MARADVGYSRKESYKYLWLTYPLTVALNDVALCGQVYVTERHSRDTL